MQAHADPPDVDALLDAVEAGNADKVRELLDGGDVGVNDSDADGGFTALYCAAGRGHVALVNMLIKSGATVNLAKENGATPLHMASQNGKLEVVKALIEAEAKVNQATEDGATPLHMASHDGNLEVVKALIEAKAKVNQATEDGCTPLYVASECGKLEVVKALIEAKAKVNLAKENGCTPLFIASQRGKLEVINVLIKAKAEVNQAKEDGITPIYTASLKDHPLVVQVLIDAGARSAELMFDGYAPLHIASHTGSLACVKVLTGFRPDTPGWATFLAGATSKKELEASLAPPGERPPSYLPKIFDRAYLEPIWKFQRERYSDLHLKDGKYGRTALDVAVANKKTDVAKLLRSMMVLPNEDGSKKATEATKGDTRSE
jgi:ankyrin repeat protein